MIDHELRLPGEPELEVLEIGFRGQGGDVELLQRFRDPLGLGAGKTSLLQLLDDAFELSDRSFEVLDRGIRHVRFWAMVATFCLQARA